MDDLQERYERALGRIAAMAVEERVSEPCGSYFRKVAEFILLVRDMKFDLSLEELQEQNRKLYQDIYPEHYETSYANPAYAVKTLGQDYGKMLSMLYTQIRSFPIYEAEGNLYNMTIYSELFVEIYDWFVGDSEKNPKELHQMIDQFYYDHAEAFVEQAIKRQVDPQDEFNKKKIKLIMESDLTDLRYLYRYGNHVGSNELAMASFLNSLPMKEIQAMADTYTEGYRIGFEVTRKDLSKKKAVELCYHIGFERIMRAAVLNFRKMGLEPVVREADELRGANSVPPNEQYEFDHKADAAAYLDKAYVERHLDCMKKSFEAHKDLAALYGGPDIVEVFGKKAFTPVNKKEKLNYDESQQRLAVSFASRKKELTNQYIKEKERSFSIIAYPIPEIGEQFEEIFEKTVELNNLDYALYRDMQQKIIDLLDQAEFVHVLGKGNNRTDLTIAIHPLQNPEKETAFENCVADINIPVGEVFTSPVLKGTTGTLHVNEVFLHQLKYVDLELGFQDGMITEYHCGNFKDEKENKDFLKEHILHHHESLPLGEFAIGTNTLAYKMGRDYGISGKLPILIAEKTGPHFAVGDTCFSRTEDTAVYNPDGKEIVARDNERSLLRKTEPEKAYYNCHTDITIPYDELDKITVIKKDGSRADVISDGKFVVPGTEMLNEPLENLL